MTEGKVFRFAEAATVFLFQLAVLVVLSLTTMLWLVIPLGCLGVLFLLQRGFRIGLRRPFDADRRQPRVCTLKIVEPGTTGLYLSNDLADRICSLAKGYAEANEARVHIMLSSSALGDEYARYVGNSPAQVLFFKVLYGYVTPLVREGGPLHYHGIICLSRFDGDDLALNDMRKSLKDLGLRVDEHPTVFDSMIRTKGTDLFEIAMIWFGSSRIWDSSTAQKLFDLETVYLVALFHNFTNRVCYWTDYTSADEGKEIAPAKHDRSIEWLSYEAHGSLKDMTYENWSKQVGFLRMVALYISGYTNLLYAGVEQNVSLSESTASFAELLQMSGPFIALLLKCYTFLFAKHQGASNVAMIYNSQVFDCRDSAVKAHDAPPRLRSIDPCAACESNTSTIGRQQGTKVIHFKPD